MKFPKSMHPEGFYDHLDKTAAAPRPQPLKPGVKPTVKAGARPLTGSGSMLREDAPAPAPTAFAAAEALRTAPSAAATAPRTPVRVERSNTAPWVLGVGVGVLLVAVAVMMSRNLSTREPVNPPATVVGQASTSAEDAQLQSAPPSAGPATPAPEQATPTEPATPAAPIVEPRREPAVADAAAVAAKPSTIVRAAPNAPAPAPVPAPVTRTLNPAPEVLAQASPPPAALQPAPAVAPTQVPAPAAAPVVPPTAPPVAQAEPQPPVAAPEDAGITVQVRTALAADATLAAVPIAVSTDHGVVKLEGQAPDAQTRERATVVASAATGVKAVDNRLTLPPATVVSQAPSVQQ
ncbi:MAG TPA: BON domain-containing protein [Roseateles sp.]